MGGFTLQRVLELRERREQALALRLAEARLRMDAALDAQRALEALRADAVLDRAAGRGAPTVGHLLNASFVLERLDAEVASARALTRAAEKRVDECLTEFTRASQDRRVLDRLKEQHAEAALAEEVRIDRRLMDTVALTRFVRRGETPGGDET